MIDSARKFVGRAPAHASLYGRRASDHREDGNRKFGFLVNTPDFVLSGKFERAELQRIVSKHHRDPGLRTAALRERLYHFAQNIVAEVVTAIAFGLTDAQKPRLGKISNGLVGTAAKLLRYLRTRGKLGRQRSCAAQNFFARDGTRSGLAEHTL